MGWLFSYLLEQEAGTFRHRLPELPLKRRLMPVVIYTQLVKTSSCPRQPVLLVPRALDLDDQACLAQCRHAVAPRDEAEQAPLLLHAQALEELPEPRDRRRPVWQVFPVLIDGDRPQGIDVQGFGRSTHEKLELLGLEQGEGIAAGDGEEAAFEGLKLTGDGFVKQEIDVQSYKLASICVGDGFIHTFGVIGD